MLQSKSVIQAVCQRTHTVSIKTWEGGLWVCKKSQKISTASDQYSLSYVNKLQGGGQIDPFLLRNRVNTDNSLIIVGLKSWNLPIPSFTEQMQPCKITVGRVG